jgi:DNA invertase Pin-like site-specific DNA recombinase
VKRVLGAIRLSRYRDADDPTTSPERQRKLIQEWADRHGYKIIGWAIDLDESAYKLSPFARRELGNWLTFRKGEFDIVAWSTFDRAIRRMADIHRLAEWAKKDRKALQFCDGPLSNVTLDFQSEDPMTMLMLQLFAFAAEMEAYNARVRVTGARAYMRTVGRYAGGWTPFGYEPASLETKGYALVQDEYGPVALRMVNDAFAGKTLTGIADWLNAEGIPTSKDIVRIRAGKEPKGHQWKHWTVAQILHSRALCGITELKEEIVYGEDGLPLRFTDEPIIDDATWDSLQDHLSASAKPAKLPRRDSPWTIGIAVCAACGRPIYANRQTVKGKTYEYMRCAGVRTKSCHTPNMKRAELEESITSKMAEEFGLTLYLAPRTIGGRNHAAEMATVRTAIGDYTKKIGLAELDGDPAEEERATLAILKTKYANLRDMKDDPGMIVYEQSGETIPQHWANLNDLGKHAMLISHGVKAKVQQGIEPEIDWGTLGAGGLPIYDPAMVKAPELQAQGDLYIFSQEPEPTGSE